MQRKKKKKMEEKEADKKIDSLSAPVPQESVASTVPGSGSRSFTVKRWTFFDLMKEFHLESNQLRCRPRAIRFVPNKYRSRPILILVVVSPFASSATGHPSNNDPVEHARLMKRF